MYFGMLGVSLLGLAACNNEKAKTTSVDSTVKTTSTVSSEAKEKVYAHGLELTILEQSIAKQGSNSKKQILSIKVKAKNQSNEDCGFGSSDFYLKNGDEKITPYVDGVNFGEAIKAGKEFQGTMTFEIPENLKKATLVYSPYEKEVATWELTF